jgi:hypothetical protein
MDASVAADPDQVGKGSSRPRSEKGKDAATAATVTSGSGGSSARDRVE